MARPQHVLAIEACELFDGMKWHENVAVLVADGVIFAIVPRSQMPTVDARVEGGPILAPGLVDLQVNGGGDTLLNDTPDAAGIGRILAAHARLGTTSLMPTLITDTDTVRDAAIAAAAGLAAGKGCLGLHLEGPHVSKARAGVHNRECMRPLTARDIRTYRAARKAVGRLVITLAPEMASIEQIGQLARARITVSLGHSDCTHEAAIAAAGAGARMVTHLYNAMSPLAHRAPGLAGAAMDDPTLFVGLIADGIHVLPPAIRIALAAKARAARGVARAKAGGLFLVSDAMPTVGGKRDSFRLGGKVATRAGHVLKLEDGTLAGADICLMDAVRHMHMVIGLELGEALQMATLVPARAIGAHKADRTVPGQPPVGLVKPGAAADLIGLDETLALTGVWQAGQRLDR